MSSVIHKIDVDLALERAGGNKELAQDLYKMLQDELPGYQAMITDCFNRADYKALVEVVHKVNGASTYCGVPALKLAASTFETQLKAGSESDYADAFNSLIDEIRTLRETPELSI